MRRGKLRVSDESDAEIGYYHFLGVVTPGDEEGSFYVVGSGHYFFPNGTISLIATFQMSDPSVTRTPRTLALSIVGGTGDFAGASGSMRAFTDDSGERVNEFDIECAE